MTDAWKRLILRDMPRENRLAAQVREVSHQLACVRDCWNMEADDDMIESYTYLLLSLEARYRYLLRAARTAEQPVAASAVATPAAAERLEEAFA